MKGTWVECSTSALLLAGHSKTLGGGRRALRSLMRVCVYECYIWACDIEK